MSDYRNKAAMEEALSSLTRYKRAMYITPELPELDEKALEEYFDCEDEDKTAQFEKMIGMAAVDAIYHDPEIPRSCKADVARKVQRQTVQAIQASKIGYEYAAGKYGVGNRAHRIYMQKKAELALCSKAALLDRIKRNLPRQISKIAAKAAVTSALTAAGASLAGPIGGAVGFAVGLAVDALWFLTPKKVKEKIKEKAKELAEKAVAVVEHVAEKIKSVPVVQKAAEIVREHVAPVVKKVVDATREVVNRGKDLARKGWKALKSLFA